MQGYLTIESACQGEYEEKRSKFIANIIPIATEEEALLFVKEMKTKYWDAKHNVFAYILKTGTARFSDDGEPHSTAGKPVLDIITKNDLTNICVVVTRYFGGILLGTGGLVRAYSEATKNALNNADIIEMGLITKLATCCDYQQYNRIVPFIENNNAIVVNTVFEENVLIEFTIEDSKKEKFETAFTDAFFGKLVLEEKGKIFSKVKNIK
ncbi:MAG: YigZ family protein [Ruminococcaceae bacterium]|nr:YigZ family protein [Oscillospiraceae bacterium]